MEGAGVDVFRYLDYRAYLRDYYEDRRKHGNLSHRAFSRRAGLKSPNYLKLVMDGARNLSRDMSTRFAKACGLKGEEAEFFKQLVVFNQAQTVDERNAAYAALGRHARYRKVHKLTLAQDLYHSRWYFPAVRELVASLEFREDPEWIAEQLLPPIKPKDAAQAIEVLLELGLLERGDDGKLCQVDATVRTDPGTRSMHIDNYQRAMISHAYTAFDRIPRSDRSVSAVTMCIGEGGIERLRKAIRAFRHELLEAAECEAEPRQVVQINFQAFPVTALQGGDSED